MRGVLEAGTIRQGHRCGSCDSASREHGAVLGCEQLAESLSFLSFQEDGERGFASGVSILRAVERGEDI